ncbi:MAG: hypothetical protein HKL95_10545 [Phycisphaerae bacterium]|nr:hypothetical protein [Phycisphaerae bacterium]
MNRNAHGTIFAVPMPDGTYIFGRVMLDIRAMLKRRLFPHDSSLPLFSDGYLVEMYSLVAASPDYVPSEVLIPGACVQSKEVGAKWPIVGREPVDPRRVEFPESLVGWTHPRGEAAFQCGEIRYPIPFTENDVFKRIGALNSRLSALYWGYTCLWAMGRRAEIPSEWTGITLAKSDLRFNPHRAEVYKHLPFPMEMSYFEKQAQMGFHVERFYE